MCKDAGIRTIASPPAQLPCLSFSLTQARQCDKMAFAELGYLVARWPMNNKETYWELMCF